MLTQNKRLFTIMIIVALLLCIPLIAMQFTSTVNWTLFDFIIAAILLTGTGLACNFVIIKVQETKPRIAIILAIVVALLLIWAELAVGIFGTPLAGS